MLDLFYFHDEKGVANQHTLFDTAQLFSMNLHVCEILRHMQLSFHRKEPSEFLIMVVC